MGSLKFLESNVSESALDSFLDVQSLNRERIRLDEIMQLLPSLEFQKKETIDLLSSPFNHRNEGTFERSGR